MTTSDFDPSLMEKYKEPKDLLHFQWGLSSTVYRYALVDTIPLNKINKRTKKKEEEIDLSHKEISQQYLKCKNCTVNQPNIFNKITTFFNK
tara:strand:+ start:171 stop:443 length:273 start_codon:yes stop_codon:yes gene_type:complete